MLKGFFTRKSDKTTAEPLYQAIVSAARRPFLYQKNPELDTLDGRFNLLSLHVILVIRRINTQGEAAKAFAQDLFDIMFKDMEAAIREIGAGDTTVGKKIRTMAEAFYGAAKAYEPGLEAKDQEALSEVLARNVFNREGRDEASDLLASYVLTSEARLLAQPFEDYLSGQIPHFADQL
ncbi:ubiquinol-cytochrome C chaperone family protein [Woodsholea maritima]|uniref:ubiquinol-cytochrome C chaperone family protein n=1 Tax=Woodsholea maritima TaxID=240237 RepID=UPI00035F2CE2|nr:ubiquinol-cytochrome C chaperone family protein [Woodsholea maritima]